MRPARFTGARSLQRREHMDVDSFAPEQARDVNVCDLDGINRPSGAFISSGEAETASNARASAPLAKRRDFRLCQCLGRHHDHERSHRLFGVIREEGTVGSDGSSARRARVPALQRFTLFFSGARRRACLPVKRCEARKVARLQGDGTDEGVRRRLTDRLGAGIGRRRGCSASSRAREDRQRYSGYPPHREIMPRRNGEAGLRRMAL